MRYDHFIAVLLLLTRRTPTDSVSELVEERKEKRRKELHEYNKE